MTHNSRTMPRGFPTALVETPFPRGRQGPPPGSAGQRLAPGRAADERGDRPESGARNGKPQVHRDRPFSGRATEDSIPGPERRVYTG